MGRIALPLLSSVARPLRSSSRLFTATSGVRFRFGPHRRDRADAQLVPLGGGLLDPDAVREAVRHVRSHGHDAIVTSALTPAEQRPFLEAGFRLEEDLDLLVLDLSDLGVGAGPAGSAAQPVRSRRMRRGDLDGVLDVDAASFPEFWRFDRLALDEARRATPSRRCRVVADRRSKRVVAYAVTGRAGDQGFVQRLAVDPSRQGNALGRTLLDDALRWLARRGATTALVNTQPGNEAALALYRSVGFTDRPGGLAVLRLDPSS